MRYKDNAVNKLTQIESSLQRIQFQINRNMAQDQLLDTVENIKSQVENLKELISIEDDEFAQQFRPR
jgi:hypothetical protein